MRSSVLRLSDQPQNYQRKLFGLMRTLAVKIKIVILMYILIHKESVKARISASFCFV